MSDEQKEIRAQRHDFVKEYYKMSTLDLDRHLKAGWQTIAVIAGGAAILTSGHDGKIGLPIATMIALFSAFWGAVTVIDANYWSLRAIAFMSNVETVYFSAEDRKNFNPYIGFHPKYKLINSLQYMFILCVLFAVASSFNIIWEVTTAYPSFYLIWNKIAEMGWMRYLLWMLPLYTIVIGLMFTLYVWRKRLDSYIEFSTGSPGPDVVAKTREMRHVTLEPTTIVPHPTFALDGHPEFLDELNKKKTTLDRCSQFSTVFFGLFLLAPFAKVFF
ncbi:hypothetical protein ACTJJ7_03570 [Phyllobacterium sp. 22229]|uniref:hypothetical protein n=1 Tax=Phyllobacterium sp. 22229 TaxID=3453895 RepID=UPI003F84C433